MRPRRLRSADAQKGSTLRDAAGSCQEGERGSCRGAGAEAQERSTSLRSTASVGHREQQLHLMFLGRRTSGRLAASGCTCGSCSCSGRCDGDWWKSRHSTSPSPTCPASPGAMRTRRSSLPRCVHRCAWHPTELWRRLLRRLLLHRSSPQRMHRVGRGPPRALPAHAREPARYLRYTTKQGWLT